MNIATIRLAVIPIMRNTTVKQGWTGRSLHWSIAKRLDEAMLEMIKIDIVAIEAARRG